METKDKTKKEKNLLIKKTPYHILTGCLDLDNVK